MTRTGMLMVTSCLVFGLLSCSTHTQTTPNADSSHVVNRQPNTPDGNPTEAQQPTKEREVAQKSVRAAEERRERDQLAGRPVMDEAVALGFADASRVRLRVRLMNSSALSGRYDPNFNTESYAHIVENGFLGVEANPLSTFSIDVDRA